MMILFILLVVAIYTGLMVWILAKLGLTPAKSVLDVLKLRTKKNVLQNQTSYKQSISVR
ncbi:hypothetical protein MUO14_00550 [Halobacillus shinanisalinarum]|uniref:Uncharacterized protein n=1 Tax=Halobacillus shinanisalinarum TaxID=2932258 RepID=A0ABY4H3H7_9BACI|nr:hypothetical protein [Halobacillus shinanisalinarum]UOQ93532.1 hypothetical protein MUO14_00550 [Halobacillus shinanisalinarum]